jgi:hypothetical protein
LDQRKISNSLTLLNPPVFVILASRSGLAATTRRGNKALKGCVKNDVVLRPVIQTGRKIYAVLATR